MLNPPPPVRANIVPGPLNPLTDARITLKGNGGCEHGGVDFVFIEQAQQPPNAGSTAIFKHRLGEEIAVFILHAPSGQFGAALVAAVAGRMGIFRTLFDVDDDVEGYGGLIWPNHHRQLCAVADIVAFWPRNVSAIDEFHGVLLILNAISKKGYNRRSCADANQSKAGGRSSRCFISMCRARWRSRPMPVSHGYALSASASSRVKRFTVPPINAKVRFGRISDMV